MSNFDNLTPEQNQAIGAALSELYWAAEHGSENNPEPNVKPSRQSTIQPVPGVHRLSTNKQWQLIKDDWELFKQHKLFPSIVSFAQEFIGKTFLAVILVFWALCSYCLFWISFTFLTL